MSSVPQTDWRALRRSLTRDAFAARFEHPLLVLGDAVALADGLSFHTELNVPDGRDASDAPLVVLPVVKHPDNPFVGRVSVGRADNCDIVIADSSVSKLHAHFMDIGIAFADVVDRGSANGTRLNGALLDRGPVRICSGDEITFGRVTALFVEAARLWELL